VFPFKLSLFRHLPGVCPSNSSRGYVPMLCLVAAGGVRRRAEEANTRDDRTASRVNAIKVMSIVFLRGVTVLARGVLAI
jgi:hypothetical protein